MRVHDCRKDMTAHLRTRIAAKGIKARVRMCPAGKSIQVFPPSFEAEFTHDEQRFIRALAVANKMTLVRGLPIDIERMTDPHGMEFHLSDECRLTWLANVQRRPNPALRDDAQPATATLR